MEERSVTFQIRTWFWGAGIVLSGIAGLVLFLLPEETDRLFAFTIVRGDTAAFIGACFLAASLLALLCYGLSSWAAVRVCFVGMLAFLTGLGLATLLHLDQFHYGGNGFLAQALAWIWTLTYLALPVAGGVLLARQRAAPGTQGRAETPIVPGLRYLYLAQGALLVVVAVVLFASPGTADTLWPWPLTSLEARAIASFLLGLGIMLVGAGRDNVAERLEPPCAASWWLAVLTGMAVLRFEGGVDVGKVPGLLFSVMVVSLLLGGLAGEMAARRLRSSTPGDT